MTDSNRVRLTHVREVTPGTTPNTPRMRAARLTSEAIGLEPTFIDSEEFRDDRMNVEPVKVSEENNGTVGFEFSYPPDNSPLSDWFESAFFSTWANTPERDNDGSADSVITAVATTNTEVTHLTGDAFVARHLVRFTGFGVANNNGVFVCTTGGTTSSRYVGSGITDEAAPPAAARMKVVGFMGASGDITATASGLGSTSLDFTTLGLVVGQWIKIGGTASSDKFANVAANNGWARITAIAATALTLDNRPSGWNTDDGASKTIKVWFGDRLRNGVTMIGQTLEKGFMEQAVPTYVVGRGQVVDQLNMRLEQKRQITGTFTFRGMGGSQSTTSLDASPDARTTNPVMAGSANVGRVAEAGAVLSSPNWCRSLTFDIRNNLRDKNDIQEVATVGLGAGEFMCELQVETYFGSNALYEKLIAGTAGAINTRVQKNGQAVVFTWPHVTFTGGKPAATARNTDVMLPLRGKASVDSVTNCIMQLDRVEYFET